MISDETIFGNGSDVVVTIKLYRYHENEAHAVLHKFSFNKML